MPIRPVTASVLSVSAQTRRKSPRACAAVILGTSTADTAPTSATGSVISGPAMPDTTPSADRAPLRVSPAHTSRAGRITALADDTILLATAASDSGTAISSVPESSPASALTLPRPWQAICLRYSTPRNPALKHSDSAMPSMISAAMRP